MCLFFFIYTHKLAEAEAEALGIVGGRGISIVGGGSKLPLSIIIN